MGKVILQKKAIDTLDFLKKYENKEYKQVLVALQEIDHFGWKYENLKPIGQGIKRLRVGRWRILCTSNAESILVWIIAREKDTKKDYMLRKNYILTLSRS
ncbi:MAG: hypothetical protein DLD55_03780 [candidate division SR1 bacterium]|nr:MAG: hypothetical protein DLD55_05090 [candidate division SR1 bacterium]PZM86964.1 MAG: hypothetical protein DLD55_03780 [candidate division SR1 bacterium]